MRDLINDIVTVIHPFMCFRFRHGIILHIQVDIVKPHPEIIFYPLLLSPIERCYCVKRSYSRAISPSFELTLTPYTTVAKFRFFVTRQDGKKEKPSEKEASNVSELRRKVGKLLQ